MSQHAPLPAHLGHASRVNVVHPVTFFLTTLETKTVHAVRGLKIPKTPAPPLKRYARTKAGNIVRVSDVGRNHPCPCGSGRKRKRCCGAKAV